MLVAGIDLAAEPKGTALALIEWKNKKAKLQELFLSVDDAEIVKLTKGANKIGIDCAFGWPVEFFEFLTQHMNPNQKPKGIDGAMDWRRTLSYRETDREVRKITGRWPLSVSTDRLGLTAMRNAGLLARYQEAGVNVDRSGEGTACEVYPGATLRLWGFDTAGYRTEDNKRAELLAKLKSQAPWLDLSDFEDQMLSSTDCFDAVIAALAARAAALGLYTKPTPEQLEKAKVEGWIVLPNAGLNDLPSSKNQLK
jgi:predicted nuclease with RNAse H fold